MAATAEEASAGKNFASLFEAQRNPPRSCCRFAGNAGEPDKLRFRNFAGREKRPVHGGIIYNYVIVKGFVRRDADGGQNVSRRQRGNFARQSGRCSFATCVSCYYVKEITLLARDIIYADFEIVRAMFVSATRERRYTSRALSSVRRDANFAEN